jgi:hypothetical protein
MLGKIANSRKSDLGETSGSEGRGKQTGKEKKSRGTTNESIDVDTNNDI